MAAAPRMRVTRKAAASSVAHASRISQQFMLLGDERSVGVTAPPLPDLGEGYRKEGLALTQRMQVWTQDFP